MKVNHGLNKVMEGGAVILTLKDSSILEDGDVSQGTKLSVNSFQIFSVSYIFQLLTNWKMWKLLSNWHEKRRTKNQKRIMAPLKTSKSW